MRFWFRFLKEKKIIIFLYVVSTLLFISVGALYHIENLGKLLYATLLAFSVWGAIGFLASMRYVRKSRRLEEIFEHFEREGELLLWEPLPMGEDRIEEAATYADAQLFFFCPFMKSS